MLVGIDLAKNSFHVDGVDAEGQPVFSQQLSRARLSPFVVNLPACMVAMEACMTGTAACLPEKLACPSAG
ncbi:MAG: hypothetical protein EA400_02080 [Chromatiaceae bacterium]|nr:MAG: hypothetical protein EA400_02080 [Chromatiaceae bacterium]